MGESVWPDGKTSSRWYDVAGLLREMEQDLSACISINIQSAGNDKAPDLLLQATAVPMEFDPAEPVRSAYAKCRASQMRLNGLEELVFSLLYVLHSDIAWKNEGGDSSA